MTKDELFSNYIILTHFTDLLPIEMYLAANSLSMDFQTLLLLLSLEWVKLIPQSEEYEDIDVQIDVIHCSVEQILDRVSKRKTY